MFQPKTGQPCYCKPGIHRDNCPNCEGTGQAVDFAAIRARSQMTPQQKMQAKLESLGLPFKEIKVYGSQVMVTAWSESAANKWHSILCKFTTSKRPVRSVNYNKVNEGTSLLHSQHEVWLIGGTINV